MMSVGGDPQPTSDLWKLLQHQGDLASDDLGCSSVLTMWMFYVQTRQNLFCVHRYEQM